MPRRGYVSLYIYMCIHDHDYVMGLYFMVMLRSTTGPYGRPITEVAYGEMFLSLHRGCTGVDSSGRVIGVSTWCRPYLTYPDQHQCGLNVSFFSFLYIYIYKPMYRYTVFKIYIYIIKEHWWSLISSWPDEIKRIFSTAHEFLKGKSKPQTVFMIILYTLYNHNFIMLYSIYEMFN